MRNFLLVDMKIIAATINKSWWRKIISWDYFWLCMIVIVTLAIHSYIITYPPEPVFDERHYVQDARSIIQDNTDLYPELMPFARLFVVAGIKIFGDNPIGWRFFSVIFGTILLLIFYFVLKKLGMSKRAINFATFLLAFENLTFLQASVAMLEVYFVTFMLLAFLFYLYHHYLLSGLSICLSALSKLFGAAAAPVIIVHWLFSRKRINRWFVLSILSAAVLFMALMPLFDFIISHQINNPVDRIEEILSLNSKVTFENSSNPHLLSRPWEWIFTYEPITYWDINYYWDWVLVERLSHWHLYHYIAAISYTVWILIIPVIVYMVFRAVKGNKACLFGIAWFAGTYIPLVLMSVIFNRASYVYYFYFCIGAICLGIGEGLSELVDMSMCWKSHRLRLVVHYQVEFYLLLHLVSFVILSPLTDLIHFY